MVTTRGRRNRESIPDEIIALVMTQYSLKAGREKFGKEADEAVISEFTKLHTMDTFIPKMKEKMTKEERKEALRTIMFF